MAKQSMKQGQKSWEYIHKDYVSRIVHVFSPNSKRILDKRVLKQKLSAIQQVECNNYLQSSIINIYNESDMSWLDKASDMQYKYVVFWYDGCWPNNDSFEKNLLADIDTWNSIDSSWIISGQIKQEHNQYPKFANSFVVLNILNWKHNESIHMFNDITELRDFEILDVDWKNSYLKLDPIGQKYALAGMLGLYENYFKNNNATNIKKYKDEIKNYPFSSWLSWCMDKNIPVWGTSDTLADCTWYVDPYLNTNEFEKGITGNSYNRDLVSREGKYVIDKMIKPSSPVYFVNTEDTSLVTVNELIDTEFEQYIGVTAGFKLLYYAYKYGINPGFTDFVWFDFDPHSCNFKRETLKQWDGTDYPGWVEAWCERNPEANNELLPMVRDRWPSVLEKFGGQDSFDDFWIQVSFSDHTVLEVDIINDSDALFNKIKNKRSFMWTSNIYSYILPMLMHEPFVLETGFTNMVNKLKSTHKDTWFCGTDTQDNDIMCNIHDVTSATQNSNLGREQ